MLRYNLMCPFGHGHYSPNQAAFVGKVCGIQGCKGEMFKYKDPRIASDNPPVEWKKK